MFMLAGKQTSDCLLVTQITVETVKSNNIVIEINLFILIIKCYISDQLFIVLSAVFPQIEIERDNTKRFVLFIYFFSRI